MLYSLSLRNYRCFPPNAQATIQIGSGVTALVGENNVGKSAFLRAISDLGPVFNYFARQYRAGEFEIQQGAVGYGREVDDPTELLFDRDRGFIEIEFTRVGTAGNTGSGGNFRGAVIKVFPRPNRAMLIRLDVLANNRTQRGKNWSVTESNATASYTDPENGATHESAEPERDFMQMLGSALYIPASRNLATGKSEAFGMPFGEGFAEAWNSFQNGSIPAERERAKEVEMLLASLLGAKSVRIQRAANSRAGVLFDVDGAPSLRADEVGSGIAQLAMALFAAAKSRPGMILIDEPEQGLHAKLQLLALSALATFSEVGLVFATHSIGLAVNAADRVYVVSRGRRNNTSRLASRVSAFSEMPSLTGLLGSLNHMSYGDLQSRHVLAVEGPSDVRVFETLLVKLGIADRVICMHIGGNSTIEHDDGVTGHLKALQSMCPHVWCVFDSERPSPGAMPAKRQWFLGECERNGIIAHASERRSIENYYTVAACEEVCGEGAGSLTEYQRYEDARAAGSVRWEKQDGGKITSRMELPDFKDIADFLVRLRDSVLGQSSTDAASG